MTISSIRTLVASRQLPSPPAEDSSQPLPHINAAPDFPFKGWQAPQPELHKQTTGTSNEVAFVIDNGNSISFFRCTLLTYLQGSSTVKAGFSLDKAPRFMFPPVMARYRDRKYNKACTFIGNDAYADATTRGQIRNAFEPGTSIVTNWDVMEGILDYIFIKLGVDYEGGIRRPIVMTEPMANLNYCRKMMNEIMFECYTAPSVTYGIDSLYSYRQNQGTSGLVISSSHTATHIIPILAGKPVAQSCARLNWGGSQAQEFLLKLLRLKYPTFPGKMNIEQMEEYVKKYCYISQEYDAEIAHYLDWSGLEEYRDIIIQYPFTEHIVPEKTVEELARISERKKESGRRLQEQAAKMRLDKLIKKEQEMEYYKNLHMNYLNAATKKEQRRLLDADDFKDEAALERVIRDLEKRIRKSRNKDLGAADEEDGMEEQTFPLLDVPDEELDEQGIKDKRHQRLLKSGVEARLRAKAEKEREKARVAEEERLDLEKRENRFDDWVAGRRAARESLLMKIKDRERLKQDAGNRKSLASQMRMKTLANLASDGPKRKRRGGGEHDDDFGANDEDWSIYRSVATEPASDEEEEEDPAAALRSLEAELLKYDPAFTEKETYDAQNDWTKSLMHAFLRGARPFDSESQKEAHQIHLNVERIRVPEVIFQPGIAGVDQAGLAEIVESIVMGRPDPTEQQALLKDVFITGGNTFFQGFEERLRRELRGVVETGHQIKVRRAENPVLDAWKGAAGWWNQTGSTERDAATITRDEYLEKGGEYIKVSCGG
jgi:actin-related protein 5